VLIDFVDANVRVEADSAGDASALDNQMNALLAAQT